MPENRWWKYVSEVTNSAPGKDIARASGLDPAVVSRWKSGRAHPRPEGAVALARAYGRPPVEALIVAGFLTAAEADQVVTVDRSLGDYPARELLDEIYRRIPEGES